MNELSRKIVEIPPLSLIFRTAKLLHSHSPKITIFPFRLVYGLTRNVILIQQIYKCPKCYIAKSGNYKRILGTSKSFLAALPVDVRQRFKVVLQRKTAMKFDLIDFLFESLSAGNNFQQVLRNPF